MSRSLLDAAGYEQRLQALAQASLIAATDRLELASGQVLERVTRPLFSAGRPQGRVWSFRDLTERLAAQERIEELTVTDGLTGLPNRARLTERVDQAVAQARKDGRSLGWYVGAFTRQGETTAFAILRHAPGVIGPQVRERLVQRLTTPY